MTEREIMLDRISALRRENYSYSFIGKTLGMPMNTVKSLCRRKGFKAEGSRKTKYEKEHAKLCRWCHKPLIGLREDAKCCSVYCNTRWWRTTRKVKVIQK